MLARFDIVLVAFPFTDGPNVKPRPALVICQSERHQDVVLAFISSKISGAANSDELDIHAAAGAAQAGCPGQDPSRPQNQVQVSPIRR
jgi:hypothetical protein